MCEKCEEDKATISRAIDYLEKNLSRFVNENKVDFVIANAENASAGVVNLIRNIYPPLTTDTDGVMVEILD